jgi:hypothetical protein
MSVNLEGAECGVEGAETKENQSCVKQESVRSDKTMMV